MDRMVSSISLVAERKDSRRIIISCATFFMILLLLAQNGNGTFHRSAILISLLGSLLAAVNFSLAYTYMHAYGKRSNDESGDRDGHPIYSLVRVGIGMYGTALLSIVLAFFGFSTMLSAFPSESEDIGYISLIILFIATYALARKVSAPKV